jgi:3-oxoacyl-[acyl-carrier-protein] synthase II
MIARPVYIRGIGAVTPLGGSWRESLPALAAGASAVAPIREFDVLDFPCTVAASVRSELATDPRWGSDRRRALLLPAVAEAWAQANAAAPVAVEPARFGVFIGAESGRAPLATALQLCRAAGGGPAFDHARFGAAGRPLATAIDAAVMSPAAVAQTLARVYGARGPVQTVSLACASGLVAIAEAARAIRSGRCDAALCGGVGADVEPLMLAGFGKLGALSARGVSRPFDRRRDGFVVGEGAAAVVLSASPAGLAGKGGGGPALVMLGEGRSLDAHHLTAPDPQGAGAERAMRAALHAAGPAAVDAVDYVQAHGTSTPLNDAVEAAALHRVFGDRLRAGGLRVSAVKGAVGHWVAGAGAVGFLCAVEALRSGTLLPTAGLSQPDPACELPHVLGTAVRAEVGAALCNAFAFGGANCAVVLGREAAR